MKELTFFFDGTKADRHLREFIAVFAGAANIVAAGVLAGAGAVSALPLIPVIQATNALATGVLTGVGVRVAPALSLISIIQATNALKLLVQNITGLSETLINEDDDINKVSEEFLKVFAKVDSIISTGIMGVSAAPVASLGTVLVATSSLKSLLQNIVISTDNKKTRIV